MDYNSRLQAECRGTKNVWVPTGIRFWACLSALKFGSFLAAAAAAAEALGFCLLVKLIFITCEGAQILWYWPWPWRWYNRQKNAQWNLKGLRGPQRGRGLKVLRKEKLELVPQKCGQALTFHLPLWPLWLIPWTAWDNHRHQVTKMLLPGPWWNQMC